MPSSLHLPAPSRDLALLALRAYRERLARDGRPLPDAVYRFATGPDGSDFALAALDAADVGELIARVRGIRTGMRVSTDRIEDIADFNGICAALAWRVMEEGDAEAGVLLAHLGGLAKASGYPGWDEAVEGLLANKEI